MAFGSLNGVQFNGQAPRSKGQLAQCFQCPGCHDANINHIRILKDPSSALVIMINHESFAERGRERGELTKSELRRPVTLDTCKSAEQPSGLLM